MFHFTQNIQVKQQWRWACNLRFCATHNMGGLATPYTNHQQHTNTMSTANHSASKYRNQVQKLEEKQSCGAHQTDNGRVGWDHQIHTSRLPRMIRNHMYTRLYQAPCQLCLTTSLLATDGISHEGPRFFTLVQPWRTSISPSYDTALLLAWFEETESNQRQAVSQDGEKGVLSFWGHYRKGFCLFSWRMTCTTWPAMQWHT